jgi:hypothetical protein
MAIQDSGQIKISDIVAEFGGTAPHGMTEYYRNGDNVPGNNTNVPESGQISLTNFYSAVNEIQQTYSSTTTNLNLATVFGGNWGSTVPKRVTINSGVTIGATSGNAAILIPSGMAGTLVIDNNGSIEGHGGAANSGAGGNAITATHTTGVTINNASGASIKAGGGGGGQGGTGGTGGNGGAGGTGGGGKYDYVVYTQPCNDYAPKGDSSYAQTYQIPSRCQQNGGDGRFQNASACMVQYYLPSWVFQCLAEANTNGGAGGAGGNSGGAGGAGGAGGVGQGYNQTNTSGSSGSAGASGGSGSGGSSGGTNAGTGGTGGARGQGGTGGTGGAGGTFGNSGGTGLTGSTGATGATGSSGANGNRTNGSSGSGGSSGSSGSSGSAGGAAGYYITNRGSITLNNSGSVAGQ